MSTIESWKQTYRGEGFFPLDPLVEDVYIDDIAHALSNICRFGGHCEQFYSVAQHSVFVSHHCGQKEALWGLMHDAAEAYIGDMISPVKSQMPEFKMIENRILEAIAKRYDLFYPMPPIIKHCDLRMLATEKRDLLKPGLEWESLKGIEPYSFKVVPVSPTTAKQVFMERWEDLTGES